MFNQVSNVFSCKACAEFWKLKTVVVLTVGIIIGIVGLNFVPKTAAGELVKANNTIIITIE
jgi:hypothetical protein